MKICIVIEHCSRARASRYVIETTKYFVKSNEVHVFANTWESLDKRVIVHKLPAFSSNYFLRQSTLTIASTVSVNTHDFDIKMAQPTRFFSPNVCMMQTIYAELNKTKFGERMTLPSRMLLKIEKYNLKKARKIIVVSKKIKQELLANYSFIPKESIHVIYNGVNLLRFTPKNRLKFLEEVRKRYGISSDDLLILFVSNQFRLKGLECVIRALASLKSKNCKLLVCGKDDPMPFRLLARKLGIGERVLFAGPRPDIHKYFAASDIFVFPTNYDAFGMVVLEAMASGLPVISSSAAGVSEIIEEGKDGLKLNNPRDHEELVEKINYLMENKDLCKKIGRRARKKAEKFSWKAIAMKMLGVFEEVMRE